MNRCFTQNNNSKTASAFCAEASFACAEMNSMIMDTVMVSIFLILALLGIILPVQRPSMMSVQA
ncbi:MAG: hypothetical protein SPI70_00870 [Oscillospiraceae bacterium]|nr:hypothetical protein [Oscillospiraceae bacterium]MDD5964206.1 hypothetical protein [Oscillospiraceae bacterium]MDY6019958.1 hypothetical protein [Oscillospiraceae bacterium]